MLTQQIDFTSAMTDKPLAPVYETPPAPDFQTPVPEVVHNMINPYEESTSLKPYGFGVFRNESNQTGDSGFKYNKFYVTKVVMIPCIILMVVFSLLLVYIIMRHLRSILKLYMSVIFYALSILYFAIQIIILLLYDQVFI